MLVYTRLVYFGWPLRLSPQALQGYEYALRGLQRKGFAKEKMIRIKNKEINKKVVQHKGLGENDPMGDEFPVYLIENLIDQEECNKILNDALDIKGATFYQKKIFISILANQFKYFLRSIFLNPNYLLGNGIAKNKPELYKIREIIIDCFIKLTNHFTKGAYDYLLQKENVSFKSFGLDYDLLKAEEAAIQELSKKKQVSFKDINPSLLLFNQDGQSLSVVTTIKPQKATKEQLQEYNNFTDLINSGNDTNKLEIHDYENINKNDVFLEELIKILDINKKTFYKKDLLEKNLTFPMDKIVNKIEFLKKHIIKYRKLHISCISMPMTFKFGWENLELRSSYGFA